MEFQRYPLKFHTKYLTHTLKDVCFIEIRIFKSSWFYELVCIFQKPPWNLFHHWPCYHNSATKKVKRFLILILINNRYKNFAWAHSSPGIVLEARLPAAKPWVRLNLRSKTGACFSLLFHRLGKCLAQFDLHLCQEHVSPTHWLSQGVPGIILPYL